MARGGYPYYKDKNENDHLSNAPLPLVIMGMGANAREVRSIINTINDSQEQMIFDFLGFIGEPREVNHSNNQESKFVCNDNEFCEFAKQYAQLGVVIPVAAPAVKQKIYQKICHLSNIVFPSIVHPRANILEQSTFKLGLGCIIQAGVLVSINVELKDFVYLNYNCTVGHDTKIGNFSTINPLAAVSGNVLINDKCLIGASSAIKQGLSVGENSVLGLGAFTVKSVPDNMVLVCNQAKPMKPND